MTNLHMKIESLTLIFTLAATIAVQGEPLVDSNLDHLAPANHQEDKYRSILESKLGPTPFDCGRAILQSPFDPETSLSVYGVGRQGRRAYIVTAIYAAENLWQRTDGCRHPERAKNVATKRLDAGLPKSTALLIRTVWLKMLQGPNGVRPLKPPANTTEVDVTFAEFSIDLQRGHALRGTLDFSLSFPGKRTKQLVDIWNSLDAYCKSSPSQRRKVAEGIDRRARELLQDLDH